MLVAKGLETEEISELLLDTRLLRRVMKTQNSTVVTTVQRREWSKCHWFIHLKRLKW